MNNKFKYFRESLKLVWQSAPGWTFANIMLSVLRSILPLLLIWLLKNLVDELTKAVSLNSPEVLPSIIWLIAAVVIIWFVDEATSDLGNYVRKKQSMKLEIYMYGLIHSKSVRLDLLNFEYSAYFDSLSRASREAPWRPNSILNNIVSLFRSLLSLLLMAGVLVVLHWAVALLLVVVNIPGIWLRLKYAGTLYNFQREQTPEARKAAYFNWLLTGDRPSREIRLFGLGNYFTALFKKSFLRTKEEEIRIIRKRTAIELVSDLVKAAAVMITLVFMARETTGGKLTLGHMTMFVLAFRQGMMYIRELLGSLAGLYEDSLFIGDIFEFLNLEEKIKAIPPVADIREFSSGISVNNISFTYPGNNSHTIKDVSFSIRKGEVVAVVGPNGAGKTTLVRLLCRLYDPDSGSISIDGKDLKNLDPGQYRKLLSVVFQDFMLYNLGAGENIRLGNISKSDAPEDIIKAARMTGIHDLINDLPDGYSTVIGNLFSDSRELSWGEWQKLAISRALFRDAPLLILDEPSSSLDADTEYEIFSRFREIVSGRTSILISHRFINVSLADRIIVLSKGSIAESGTHDELMEKKGIYHSMYTKQTSRFRR
ncbi:MAG TPA: ABC transporter ATP-binding protein [Bacteroidales bacterium]|jgi:ATP-binding cassette subfamily B protein|nr:ABC transporter ATP-binding protein [Bacteroidales bacterium]HOS71167.1 ABC transporter ATP-binding protein [Bacteroidales bacterium]HQH23830.1 ABC transporter ATP-binding protein [Bacteroidales bacterium]HQJ81655.1 ABC transporter ATP-binding protein [Bacteroidales bacterium]